MITLTSKQHAGGWLAPLRCRSIHDILQDLAGHSGASTVSDVHVTWCKTSKCSFLPVFLAACLIASDPSLNQLLVDSVFPTQSLFSTHSLNHSGNHSTTYVCNPVGLTLITHALKQTRSQLLGQLHKLSLTPELTRFTPSQQARIHLNPHTQVLPAGLSPFAPPFVSKSTLCAKSRPTNVPGRTLAHPSQCNLRQR